MSSNFLLLDFLLPEILSKIFSFLPIEDRKQVRLVCRKWNDCCNCPAILSREKFIFHAGHTLENIDLFLRNCEKIRNSVEFHGLNLDELSDEIWQMIGKNIYSLKLFECTGTTKVTKNIFLHCSNMHSFKSSNELPAYYGPSLDDTYYAPAMWDELIQLNIERQKMIVFHLFFEHNDLPKDVIQKIFKIFPSIHNFGTGYLSYSNDYANQFLDRGHQVSLLNTFNPVSIQELIINVPCSGLWIQEFSNVPELKLQKLETILINPTVSLEIFAQFLQNQRELKTLNIMLRQTTETDYTKVMLSKILSICTELIDFRFKTNNTPVILKVDEFYRVLQKVSKSKLECFMIWFTPSYQVEDLMIFHDNLTTYLPPLTNKRLRTLKLNVGMGEGLLEEYCLPILQHFYDLHYLEIAAVSDGILQTIFKYHIHLRTLILCKIDHCTAFGFTGNKPDSFAVQETSYSISRLQELKYLEVEGSLDELWVEKIIRHFNFPRLKYLSLTLWELKKEINLQFLPTMIPLVEVLKLEDFRLHVDEYSFLCQHMPRLKVLMYVNVDPSSANFKRIPLECFLPVKIKFIENLFIVRPSLKYVADWNCNHYSYDRFSKALNFVDFEALELEKSVICDGLRM